jgi:hypothetical protein
MAHLTVLENFKNLEAGQGRLEPDIFEIGGIGHG